MALTISSIDVKITYPHGSYIVQVGAYLGDARLGLDSFEADGALEDALDTVRDLIRDKVATELRAELQDV